MLAHGFRATGVAAAACALVLGLSSASAAGSGAAARNGVVLIDRGGGIAAVNVNGSGVHQLTTPGRFADNSDSDPVASLDGARVFDRAFVHVYVMNADGSGLRRLGPGIDPEWSPDSRWLAASSTFPLDQGLERVYVMKPGGSVLRRIGRGDGPSWSPDGRWLAYEGDLRNDETGTYVAHPDGTGKLRLAKSWWYSWSPEGKWLAYFNDSGLRVVDPDTNERRLVFRTKVLGDEADLPGRLSWSPDSTRIAFLSNSYGGSVYVAALDGSKPRRIGPPSAKDTAVWSPDGTRIAYTADIGNTYPSSQRVTVVDVSTGHSLMSIRPIAGDGSQNPIWSRNGSALVFLRGNANYGGNDVWVVSPDGTGLSQLTTAFPFDGVGSPPTWWPGRLQVAPDPAIETVALHSVAKRRMRGSYFIAGADRTRVAIDRVTETPRGFISGAALGVWRGPGRIAWIRNAGGDSAAFGRAGVYWASSDHHPGYFDAYLYFAAPGRPPRLLRSPEESVGSLGSPFFSLQGDGLLAVCTRHGSLWRLRGRRLQRIRHERTDFSLFAVDGGRILLQRSDRRVELLSSNGRLLRTLASRAKYVGGALSARRLVLVGSRRVSVFDTRTGHLRASWPVGAPGVSPSVGFMYKSLLPNSDGSALHVLDVDTGHDLIVRIPGVTEPIGGAITKSGLVYTWTQTYSLFPGRMAVVPLRDLVDALKAV